MYDGLASQVRIRFKASTGTIYPLLLEASPVGLEYGLRRDSYMVVDHQGIALQDVGRRWVGISFQRGEYSHSNY